MLFEAFHVQFLPELVLGVQLVVHFELVGIMVVFDVVDVDVCIVSSLHRLDLVAFSLRLDSRHVLVGSCC